MNDCCVVYLNSWLCFTIFFKWINGNGIYWYVQILSGMQYWNHLKNGSEKWGRGRYEKKYIQLKKTFLCHIFWFKRNLLSNWMHWSDLPIIVWGSESENYSSQQLNHDWRGSMIMDLLSLKENQSSCNISPAEVASLLTYVSTAR